jgi:hypothetical protein
VPPFLPRVLELQFEKPPEGKSCSMMPWKFGQKVDYWHPADEVLEAWKTASGMDSGLQISFTEGSFFLSFTMYTEYSYKLCISAGASQTIHVVRKWWDPATTKILVENSLQHLVQ